MLKSLWTLLCVLGLVVLILYAAWWTTRQIAQRGSAGLGFGAPGGDAQLCVLAQLRLGRSASLVVARVGARCCLLGVTEQRVELLRELEEDEAGQWLERQGSARMPGFLEILAEAARKGKQG